LCWTGTQPSPKNGGTAAPNFRPISIVDEDATLYGGRSRLVPGDIALDGYPAPPSQKGAQQPPVFGPCLLWPNGWMDQDATWYGDRPRLRPHWVRWGPSHPHGKGHCSLSLFGPCLWPNGRPSRQLLSSCTKLDHPPCVQHLSNDDCPDDKREDYQNCSVLYCVRQLCTVIRARAHTHTHTHTHIVGFHKICLQYENGAVTPYRRVGCCHKRSDLSLLLCSFVVCRLLLLLR